MDNPFLDWFTDRNVSGLANVREPKRTFDDVILPERTRRSLDQALVQIEKHDLLYHKWGLAERHSEGLGLAFNFAGPPGTGKTICAEAVAHRLGKKLYVVRHADMQSMWVGRTGKNVVSVFEAAEKQDAVLFFDEADAIAGSRFDQTSHGYEREANTIVNVLLSELEQYNGVVIFATNLATSLDPAFERRIRTHVVFDMPDAPLREQIWKVQLHQHKTPLADDVDFADLAQRYEVSGGDIKNAVLKAAQAAIAEPGPDDQKVIRQQHFAEAMEDVLASKSYMSRSSSSEQQGIAALQPFFQQWESQQEDLAESVHIVTQRQGDLLTGIEQLREQTSSLQKRTNSLQKRSASAETMIRVSIALALLALGIGLAALALAFLA